MAGRDEPKGSDVISWGRKWIGHTFSDVYWRDAGYVVWMRNNVQHPTPQQSRFMAWAHGMERAAPAASSSSQAPPPPVYSQAVIESTPLVGMPLHVDVATETDAGKLRAELIRLAIEIVRDRADKVEKFHALELELWKKDRDLNEQEDVIKQLTQRLKDEDCSEVEIVARKWVRFMWHLTTLPSNNSFVPCLTETRQIIVTKLASPEPMQHD